MDAPQLDSPAISAQSAVSPAPAPRPRPFGLYAILTLLSLQALLGGLVTAALGLGLAAGSEDVSTFLVSEPRLIFETVGIMLAVIVVVVGLWRYRLWAWYGMMLLLAYWMATDAIAYFGGAPDYISMVLNVAMVFYLNQLEVKVLFEARTAHDGASV